MYLIYIIDLLFYGYSIQKWNFFSALELYDMFLSHMSQEGQETCF